MQLALKLCSQHMHIHIYTLYVLYFPFPLTQDDWQELPFHTFVPWIDWEMPQRITGGELICGEWFPNHEATSAFWNCLMPALTVFISRALETLFHAIKHDNFMQRSSVDASSSEYLGLLGTAQLWVLGMKEHAQRSDRGCSPPNTEK